MDDSIISNFTRQLDQHPENWGLRAHVATLLEQKGDAHAAAAIVSQAPNLPSDPEHLATIVRILTPVNPGAALPYIQMLKASALSPAGGFAAPSSAAPVAMAAPAAQTPAAAAPQRVQSVNNPGSPSAPQAVSHQAAAAEPAAPVHTGPPVGLAEHVELIKDERKAKFSAGRFTAVILAHAGVLFLATIWVVGQYVIGDKKEDLKFDSNPPRTSATKGMENNVKLAKKKSSSSAPSAAKRILSAGPSKISLPAIEMSSPVSDTSFAAMAGMGGMGGGIGFGGAGGNGTGGAGIGGGGKGNFMGGLSIDSRCSKGDREQRIVQSGGDPTTELKIGKALEWFKKNQNPDGSWGKAHKASMTGLAILSYMGHCETPDSSPNYGETVLKGIMYLIELQQKNAATHKNDLTKVRISTAGPTSGPAAYEHGIATYALSEAYSMTRYGRKRIPGLREAVTQGVEIIIKGQDADGGWNYGYQSKEITNAESPTSTNSDLSVAGWQIQALNAARHTGLTFAGADEAWKKIGSYLKAMQAANGTFGYRSPGGRWALTGVGGLCLVVAGDGRTGEMRKAVGYLEDQMKALDKRDSLKRAELAVENTEKRIKQLEDGLKRAKKEEQPKLEEELTRVKENFEKQKTTFEQAKAFVMKKGPSANPDWFRTLVAAPGGEMGLYGQYYVNQVAFMKGGNFWRQWNEWIQSDIFPAQSEDGSFPLEGGGAEGAHGSGGAGADAAYYRTALATLMMEVYYRYLPATDKRVMD